MTESHKVKSVYRYFDLADSFVQILVPDADALRVVGRPGLDRASYRRLVIETCCPDFRGDIAETLEMLFPEDPLMVEDLLYELCVDVNPGLDIHEVRLTGDGEFETEPAPHGAGADDGLEAALERLRRRARGLEARLGRSVVGQEQAVRSVARAVSKAAVGLSEESRPLSSFLLVGRTGTGKTELARVLARELFGSDTPGAPRKLVRVDCGEFAMAHEYSKLIGSPPGYVGHEDGGQLTDAVAKNPDCVVLFDEIEKAHPRLHNLLLGVLEEGALTDGKGRRVDFSRSLVLLTSNVGAEEVRAASKAVGFGDTSDIGRRTLASITSDALEQRFSPEFLGRIDETILFEELEHTSAVKIAKQKLFDLAQRARSRGLMVSFSDGVARWVARRGFSASYGARELKRVVQREIEPELSALMLEGRVRRTALLRVRVRRGELDYFVDE